MYILGLSPFWGTSRISPAWSPSEHQLTPAMSPIWGPRPKPCRPEEVVYSPNDSCSHFTQCLFPPKLPQQHTCTSLHCTFTIIHTYYTSHSSKQLHPFIYMISTLSFLPSVSCVCYTHIYMFSQIFLLGLPTRAPGRREKRPQIAGFLRPLNSKAQGRTTLQPEYPLICSAPLFLRGHF
jgi:hypothetical protein